jgi:hypothetical protein
VIEEVIVAIKDAIKRKKSTIFYNWRLDLIIF